VDLCEAIDCAPIITFNDREEPQDAADFVEYCWGDGNTTWGSRRIADGHPAVYNVTHIEVSATVHIRTWQTHASSAGRSLDCSAAWISPSRVD
jgi:alpha-L-arabinofuranosidase